MTISTATLQRESLLIGATSNQPVAPAADIVYREFGPSRPLPLQNTTSLSSLIDEFEVDPAMAAHLANARRNLAASMYADELETLSAVRLAAGLSQAQLAVLAQTTQPYIARIERGKLDPSTDMIARIAQALGTSEDATFRAIRLQRSARG